MNSVEQWMTRLLIVAILLGGVILTIEGNTGYASDSAFKVSEKKIASGMVPTHPPGNDTKGEELYNASCLVCHGPRGTGGVGPRLMGNPVLSNEQAFWKVVYEGRHVMPPLKDAVTEQQMADIQAWLKTVR
ncbi:MAG TPA: cytochrome c [Nitrospiraceae bacterium]|jgi:mono/diheme cytochrome c family protein